MTKARKTINNCAVGLSFICGVLLTICAVLYSSVSNAARPTGGNIPGQICPGYGFYPASLGLDCPPPPAPPPYARTGYLAFSDLINGPDTGLGDGIGSGSIVTIWGYQLGATQGTSTIEFCDVTDTCRPMVVYYWKAADGQTPGGPANLWKSHRIYEVAAAIPDSAPGPGEIKFTVNGEEDTLPFTVRSGAIYHVRPGGSNTNPGTYASAFADPDYAINNTPPGSVIYVHDVHIGSNTTQRGVYWNEPTALSTKDNHMVLAAYPGFQPSIMAKEAVHPRSADALVTSKFDLMASNYNAVDANDQPTNQIGTGPTWAVRSTRFGRTVGTRMSDIPGGCASRYQGAITGDAAGYNYSEGHMIYGNEIYEYGCAGTDKLHHTVYLSIRSGDRDIPDLQVEPWEYGWNYLHDNHAKNGIHVYDEGTGCGDLTDTMHIHNNVVVDQGGSGIFIGTSGCTWFSPFEVYNNVLIRTGGPADWDGVNLATVDGGGGSAFQVRVSGLISEIKAYNNTIYEWNAADRPVSQQACFYFVGTPSTPAPGLPTTRTHLDLILNDNICYTSLDWNFLAASNTSASVLQYVSGDNNIWHYTGSSPTNAIVPSFDAGGITGDPLLTITEDTRISVGVGSPAIDASTTNLKLDVYGNTRAATHNIGAVE